MSIFGELSDRRSSCPSASHDYSSLPVSSHPHPHTDSSGIASLRVLRLPSSGAATTEGNGNTGRERQLHSKELAEARKKKRKRNYTLEQELARLWEKMRLHEIAKEDRAKLVTEALQKMKGKIHEIAGSHIFSRVLQWTFHPFVLKRCWYSEGSANKGADKTSKNKMEMDPSDRGLGTVRHLRIEPLGGDSVWWKICPSTQWGRFVGEVKTLDTGGGVLPNPRPIQEHIILDVKLPWQQLRPLGIISDTLPFDRNDSGDSGGSSSHPSVHDSGGTDRGDQRRRSRSSSKGRVKSTKRSPVVKPVETKDSLGYTLASPLGEKEPTMYTPCSPQSESEDIIWLSETLSDDEVDETPDMSIDTWNTSDLTKTPSYHPDLARFGLDWVPVTQARNLESSLPGVGGSTWSCP